MGRCVDSPGYVAPNNDRSEACRAEWLTDVQDIPATATPLFRTGASDIALPMAQRLGAY